MLRSPARCRRYCFAFLRYAAIADIGRQLMFRFAGRCCADSFIMMPMNGNIRRQPVAFSLRPDASAFASRRAAESSFISFEFSRPLFRLQLSFLIFIIDDAADMAASLYLYFAGFRFSLLR